MIKFLLLFVFITSAYATKVGDIANVVGVRDNHLIGYSLVVGLKKTGDGTTSKFTLQSIANMLKAMNIDMKPIDIKSKNVAAVVVTAELEPFARQGDKININVSSIGDASSLEGGTLLMTPLKGVDGKIYALAQGSMSIGGMNTKGGGVASHPTTGIIYNGGLVEREIATDFYNQEYATLSLKEDSFKNSVNVQNALNGVFGSKVAAAIDSRTIRLKKPQDESMIEFLATIQDVDIELNNANRIVINERTGTIVSGIGVSIKPIVLTHSGITIKVLSSDIDEESIFSADNNELVMNPASTTVANLVSSLQKIGATPKDIISILEAMKSAGSINAELKLI
ncbi:MAG: flagellar basal body P-ring protein FlgI [Sulfurimonas sp.]|jgi:flagellar P-ring protein precursor FlgI|nr:flagellar basal body P-ring protein FlgI [Sulfurimonadaceae bacterium]